MKNYNLKIYFTDRLSLACGLQRVYVNSIFFEKCTYRLTKGGEENNPFDVITFLRNGKVFAMFFPNSQMDYEVVECD